MNDFFATVAEWRDLVTIIHCNFANSLVEFSRERLLDKIHPIIQGNLDLFILIESFCNIPIYEESGRDHSKSTGIPAYYAIDTILFNIILDDIDRDMERKYPNIRYVRFQHRFLFGFSSLYESYIYTNKLNNLFLDNSFVSPTVEVAFRGDNPLSFAGVNVGINAAGQCEVKFPNT